MNKFKIKQSLTTSLTALATAMLCQTTATYASDIQIYKAPTQGGAYLMMVLDFSTSMQGSSPVKSDFFNGVSCTSENHTVSTIWNNTTYSFPGKYCFVKETTRPAEKVTKTTEYIEVLKRDSNNSNAWYRSSFERDTSVVENVSVDSLTNRTARTAYSSLPSEYRDKVDQSCFNADFYEESIDEESTQYEKKGSEYDKKKTGGKNYENEKKQRYTRTYTYRLTKENGKKYSCPDRVTMLKKSIYDLIAGTSTVNGQTNTITPLVSTASVGFTRFPNSAVTQVPVVLNTTGRATLLSQISSYVNESGTPIGIAYATGAAGLMQNMPTGAEAACAGYGVYFLTDGEPYSDSRTTTRNIINPFLKTDHQTDTTNCNSSWGCVTTIADKLKQKNNINDIEIKTAVVGFGNEFSFGAATYDPAVNYKYSGGDPVDGDQTDLRNLFSAGSYALEAAKASVVGGGGWYSATNTTEIVKSVKDFVASVTVTIPSITTGTSAIPQDTLNTSVIQPYAYFPQFQPKPSDKTQAWTGNLKKYSVNGGLLKGKNNTALFSSAGVINTAVEDLWTQNYATSTQLTSQQQSLKILGGLLSRLNLKANNTDFQRTVYTNSGDTVSQVNKSYMDEDPRNRGYFLGLMGYEISPTEISQLPDEALNLTTLNTRDELRQIGAVMHSTPVLLTQSGKITYSDSSGVDTTNRNDYILFGTTQGVLHVVKAGTASDVTTVNNTAGNEVFAFVPEEMVTTQPTALLNPKNTPQQGMEHLYYGVDGQWTAHTEYVYVPGTDTAPEGTFKVYEDDNKYGKQWVYGGLRMGGKSYYALDLTRLTALTNNQPAIKFRINPDQSRVDGFTHAATENSRYANLAKMGQSWSKPTLAHVQWKGKRRLVMFVGGGYDPEYEDFKYNQTNGVGAGVYMFDADTGEFLWSTYDAIDSTKPATAPYIGDGNHLKYSVVSQIKTVDREGDGDVDHLYFGDLGGQVFRIDLDKNHPKTGTTTNFAKQITRIYNGHIDGGYSPRFYEMPAFTVYSGANGLFAVISIGSGNRSTPLLGKQVNNQYIVNGENNVAHQSLINDAIYNIYDKVVVADKPHEATLPVNSPTIANLFQITDSNRELGTTTATNPTPSNLAANKENTSYKGWYYAFTSSVDVGDRKAVEKVQGELIAIDNDLYVSTFDAEGVGTTESCGAGIYGNSRAHRFCMPYGQCDNGDTVEANTMVLGKGLLGITVGPGTNSEDRRIIAPVSTLDATNKITSINYAGSKRLIPQSWYEKN